MSFLSRLLTFIKRADEAEEMQEAMEGADEGGLFMSTEAPAGRLAEAGVPIAELEELPRLRPLGQATGAPGVEEAPPPLEDAALEAAQESASPSAPVAALEGGEAAPPALAGREETGAPLAPPEQENAPGGESAGDQSVGGGEDIADDDPLAAFQGSSVNSELRQMAGELEDTPIEELLTGLRDLRGMLPQAASDLGGGTGEDGQR